MTTRADFTLMDASKATPEISEEGLTPPSKRVKVMPSPQRSQQELGVMRDGSSQLHAGFVGSASGIHFIHSVYGAFAGTARSRTSPQDNLVPGEDDHLGNMPKTI